MAIEKPLLPQTELKLSRKRRSDNIVATTNKPFFKIARIVASEDWRQLSRSPAVLATITILLVYLVNHQPFNQVDAAVLLSYGSKETSTSLMYRKGPRDLCYVAFRVTVFLSLRRVLVDHVFPSIAKASGAKSCKRFSEQLFSLTYFCLLTSFGVLVTSQQGTWSLTLQQILDRETAGTMSENVKMLYLVETAWWFHEVVSLVLGLEKQRRDFKELACHHIVTVILIVGSYWYNYIDFGIMILVPHGASDALLSLAKILTYTKSRFMTVSWLSFLAIWLYGRHYLMIRALIMAVKYFKFCFDLNLPASTRALQLSCLLCLTALQFLNLFWLTQILKGLHRATKSEEHHRDIRSEDESSD